MDTATRTTIESLLWKETYHPEELAALLTLNLDVIRHAVFTGALPATVVGQDIVTVRREDVLRWLAERE